MITRRLLLAAGLGVAVGPVATASANGSEMPIWPGEPPGGGGPGGALAVDAHGGVTNVVRPGLIAVLPEHPTNVAVLVAAGGGYKRIEIEREAMPAARWLAAQGIAAHVLTYRLPAEGWTVGPLAPLQDALRALRMIRAGVAGRPAPRHVGVLGFSAGGHLMGLTAARSSFAFYDPVDSSDRQPARPDATALIYPVITLLPPYDHTSTRRSLVGDHPTPEASAEWSVETHVGPGCPPMFLVQAEDDPISDPANTHLMAEACRAAGVPVDLHRLSSGGHGFGMGRPGTPSAAWPDWYAEWLRQRGLLASS